MGYTHNWYRPQIIAPATFQAITNDFQRILPALEAAGSPIANAWGRETVELSSETVQFNGVENCGHTHNPAVRLPGPTPYATGIGDNAGMGCTLPYRTCNGDCSYETFRFDRCMEDDTRDDNGLCGGCCKTAFRPYDLAVTVFLLISKQYIGRDFRIQTDGKAAQWQDAQRLCLAELGYTLSFEEVVA